jgi:hypothetical protein
MGIRSEIAEALPEIFTDMGEDATYTPVLGDPLELKIFIDFDVQFEPGDLTAQTWQTGTQIEILLEDVEAEPSRGATFLYDETTYTVLKVIQNDGFTVKMAVK